MMHTFWKTIHDEVEWTQGPKLEGIRHKALYMVYKNSIRYTKADWLYSMGMKALQ
jgi:hypothetical protein